MNPITVTLTELLEGEKQYTVDPKYHYTATAEDWEAFWQSVLKMSANPWTPAHVLGNLELEEIPPDSLATSNYLILQGENILVTSQVFLYALYDEGLRRELDTVDFVAPLGMLLMRPSGEAEQPNVSKLQLAGDCEALTNMAAGKMREECGEPFTPLAGAYKYFQGMLKLKSLPELMRFREAVCTKFVVELIIRDEAH
jgi:hypothetical protein